MLNVQSLNNSKISCIEAEYVSVYNSLGFVCLTETWATRESLESLNIDNFYLSSYFCRTSCKGGGVGIWTRSGVESLVLNLDRYCQDKHFEVCASKILFENKSDGCAIILTCYRSPSGDLNIFLNSVSDLFDYIFKSDIRLFFCGDFNLDIKSNGFKHLCNIMLNYGMVPIVGWPTRVAGGTCSTIDNVFTNFPNGSTCVFDCDISDHRAVLVQGGIACRVDNEYYSYARRYTGERVEEFHDDLLRQDWSPLLGESDPNMAFDRFFDIFRCLFEKCFPFERNRKRVGSACKAWVNSEIRDSSVKLKDLYLMKSIYPHLQAHYNTMKKRHASLVVETKKYYFQSRIFRSDNPSMMAWRTIRSLSGIKGIKHSNLEIQLNNELIEDPARVADAFNNYFIETPIAIADDVRSRCADGISVMRAPLSASFFLSPISEGELLTLIRSRLSAKWSAGPDEIPSVLIKRVADAVAAPLVFLINLSFQEGIFPDALKDSVVIPVYKKGDSHVLANYRPIALTSVFSKIFEYAFLARLVNFLKTHDVISRHQHGFLSQKSTGTAMGDLYGDVLECLSSGGCPAGIFCDLSKAFDCVDHSKLQICLEACGIRGVPGAWVASFLRDRRQSVSVKYKCGRCMSRCRSSFKGIRLGVPQGSVLGPVLFLLYINDLDRLPSDGAGFTVYADDVSVIVSDRGDVQHDCDVVLAGLERFFAERGLHFNADKTKYMTFHNYQRSCSYPVLKLGDHTVERVTSLKFLGFHLDEHLSWREHCESLVAKLHSVAYLIKSLRALLTQDQLISLYYAQCVSRILYGIGFWGKSSATSNVFLAQKRVLRAIAGVPQTFSCRGLFKQYGVLTFYGHFIMELCVFVFLNRNDFARCGDYHNYNTRHKDDYTVVYNRLNVCGNAPCNMGPKLYNKLPDSIKNVNGVHNFKKDLKKYLIDKCIYSVNEFLE